VGLVSDGNYFSFVAFQLNTLDFDNDEGAKNIVWYKQFNMFPEPQEIDLEALQILYSIFRQAVPQNMLQERFQS